MVCVICMLRDVCDVYDLYDLRYICMIGMMYFEVCGSIRGRPCVVRGRQGAV